MISSVMQSISSSATLDITVRAKCLKKEGFDVVNFAGGEPDFDTPDYIKKAAIEAINKGLTKYTPAAGTPELKEAIVRKFKNDNKLDYKSGQIVVSCGAKHSLYNAFRALCEQGDEVLLPSPYWLSYPEMIKMCQAKTVIVKPSNGSPKVKAKDIEKYVTKKTKVLVINSPSNPSGVVYGENELKEISDLAVKHNIFVISDEIYEKLIYDGARHVSIASLNKDINALTIVINGVSKSYSMTGWRIGYAAGREEIMKVIAAFQSHATSNPCSISQAAALCALSVDDPSMRKMVAEFEKRRNIMIKELNAMKNIKCEIPGGAFYCFADVSETGMDAATFSKRLIEEKYIATIPGESFGAPDHVRFSFATSASDIEKGMERLREWLRQ